MSGAIVQALWIQTIYSGKMSKSGGAMVDNLSKELIFTIVRTSLLFSVTAELPRHTPAQSLYCRFSPCPRYLLLNWSFNFCPCSYFLTCALGQFVPFCMCCLSSWMDHFPRMNHNYICCTCLSNFLLSLFALVVLINVQVQRKWSRVNTCVLCL